MADESLYTNWWATIKGHAAANTFDISDSLDSLKTIKKKEVEIEEITQNQRCNMCLRPGCTEHSEKDLIHQEEEKCLHRFLQARRMTNIGILIFEGIFCIACNKKISE